MKSYFTLFLIILFCGVHAYVTILLSSGMQFERRIISLMTHIPVTVLYGSICLLESGRNSVYDRQIQCIGKLIIFVFLLMYCLNSMGLVNGVTQKLFWFYGINLVGLLMILISTYRHGNFKD